MHIPALLISERFELVSTHSPADCVRLIAAAIDRETLIPLAGLWGSKPVIGTVGEFSVRMRRRLFMSRNSFQTVLTAWIRPYGTGAIIGGECGMHPLVFAFLISWFGMLMLFGAAVIASAVSGPRDADQGILPFLLVLAGMGTFGLLLVICGRYTARSESRFLIDFLAGTVDGKPPLPAG